MALKWIIGDFRNGAISESNELPVVYNEGDKVEIDVNANESATITVSKNDLPSDWRTYLRPVDRFVALIETDLAWASSVIWAGFINKASARVNETVQIQATGLREYMAARIVSNTYNSTNANPETSVVFQSAHHRGLMANMILACFSSSGIPSASPKPPQVLSSVTGSASGSTVSHSVLLSDFESYGNMLDEWRDELSDNGQEYRFTPSWSSSSKTAIRWVGEVATPTAPHFNEASTLNIVLGDNEWKPIAYGQSASSDNMVSRIIGQSKEGANKAGADYTTRTTTSSTSILLDESWNPGVELTTAQMTSNLTARLNYNSQTFKEADFSRAYETTAELRTIISQLGSMATFSGSGASQYFGLTMRIVGVSFNPSKKTVELQLAPKAARYPKLPKDNRGLKKKSETKNTGRPKKGVNGLPGSYGDYTNPIREQPRPGSNGSEIGSTPVQIPPPFSNPKDIYTDTESVITDIDRRWFDSLSDYSSAEYPTPEERRKYYHQVPIPTRSRFNHNTGEYMGLRYEYNVGSYYNTGTEERNIRVIALDIPGMFDRDSNFYKNTPSGLAKQNNAVNYRKIVGVIPFEMFSDLSYPWQSLQNEIPQVSNSTKQSYFSESWNYNFWTSEDFQEVYVQVYFIVCKSQVEGTPEVNRSYYKLNSRVFKGTRDENGMINSWETINNGLKYSKDGQASTFVSSDIYQINGQYYSFGGYFMPDEEMGEIITGIYPTYELKYYSQQLINVDLSAFEENGTEMNIDLDSQYFGDTTKDQYYSVNYPLTSRVDYSNNKVIVGFSKIYEKETSVFFEADFSNLTNFKKVLNTTREPGVKNWYSFNQVDGQLSTTREMEYKYNSTAPMLYKNNYFMLNNTGNNDDKLYLYSSTEKTVGYIRGKKGWDDTVEGKIEYPNAYNQGYSSNTINDVLISANNGYSIGTQMAAFHLYQVSEPYRTGLYVSNKLLFGFDYYVFNGYIYMICDTYSTNEHKLSNPTAVRNGYEKFRYWVGKYSIDDTKL